jgi:peptidyl-prolyl cis-trans isomerase C
VAGDAIATQTVLRVAAAQRIDLEPARERAVSDALFAAFARERYARTGRIESIERAAHGRSILEELGRVAESQGAPTDEEVAELTAERWFEFDRPVCVRTTHAVVRVSSPEQKHKAYVVAERIAGAVRGVKDPAEFTKRARAVPRDGLDVAAEGLEPTTVDGRVHSKDPAQRSVAKYDPAFARAAHAIAEPGEQSPIIETKFGFHVILLEERILEQRVPLEERRRKMAGEIVMRRAQRAERELLERLRSSQRVEIERAAEDLTANVRIKP